MLVLFIISAIGALYLICFMAWFRYTTNRLLAQHQSEWDEIKQSLELPNMNAQKVIADEYLKYITSLPRHPCVGKCFPKM